MFSLSGKMDFQIPCFPCAVATLIIQPIFSSPGSGVWKRVSVNRPLMLSVCDILVRREGDLGTAFLARVGQGSPVLVWGIPLLYGLTWVPPPPIWTWDQWGGGILLTTKDLGQRPGSIPPLPPRQTHTCQNSTFPSYYVHGR